MFQIIQIDNNICINLMCIGLKTKSMEKLKRFGLLLSKPLSQNMGKLHLDLKIVTFSVNKK